jgi:hypothetical protein
MIKILHLLPKIILLADNCPLHSKNKGFTGCIIKKQPESDPTSSNNFDFRLTVIKN